MSIIIQTNSGNSFGSSVTAPFNQNVQKGSSILVGIVCNGFFTSVSSITDTQGNAYALVKMSAVLHRGDGTSSWVALYACNNAAGGADTITINLNGFNGGPASLILIAEVNGALAGVDATATASVLGNSGDSFPSMSLPVTNSGELVFTLLDVGACNNGSAPSGFSSFFLTSSSSADAFAWTQTAPVGTDTIQWGGTVTAGNSNVPINMVAAAFFLTPPSPQPVQAVVGNQTGNPIQFFGVTPTNPAKIQTQSNSQQVFTFDSTSHGGIPVGFRYADDANFLGRTAMPGQLLVLPGNGWFRGTSYFVCASGTITIPLSAQNAGVSFTLFSNKFVNLASSGLNIQISSDVLATLPNSPLSPSLNSYTWSLVAPISGGFGPTTSTLNCVGTWNLNGNPTLSSGSSSISNGITGPKAQFSIGVTFSGTVSGSDQFQATLSQFEIQEI